MPSHNHLAVSLPAPLAMNLGVNIREQISISHRGDPATARLQSGPSEAEIQKAFSPQDVQSTKYGQIFQDL